MPLGLVAEIIGMFTSGARYLTADIDLFRDEDVFSRFQMIPTRPEPGRVGEKALAGTGVGALAGWCSRAFRVHDYLLGWSNMKAYLTSELVLSGDNSLFKNWSDGMRADYAVNESGIRIAIDRENQSDYFLSILPDLTLEPAPLPSWPLDALNPNDLHDDIVTRLEAALKRLRADNLPGFSARRRPW